MSYIIGIMSGTSLDGIDVAIVDINGVSSEMMLDLIAFKTYSYPPLLLDQIRKGMNLETNSIQLLSHLNFALGEVYAKCVIDICKESQIDLSKIELISSHGQTMFHHPQDDDFTASTMQLGESTIIAERTKTPVVSNFREADIACGGQGAPIVPFSEYFLYRNKNKDRILQNIGGIGNLTFIPKNGNIDELVAFDTGPGNMIIDELCQYFFNESYDKDGLHGKKGMINDSLLNDWMNLPYFRLPYPKTTGRELFGEQFVRKYLKITDITPEDLIATATAFTAESIAYHVKQLGTRNFELIVGGGGAHNPFLINEISKRMGDFGTVMTQENLGYSSDAKEAVAMAVLGWHTWNRIPSNIPSSTGATHSTILGKITLI